MMGVDYELFWTLNPITLSPFIKAFDLKIKNDDMVAWQHGLYVKMAIASSMDKDTKYPSQPFTSENKVEEVVMSSEEIKARVMNKMKFINSQILGSIKMELGME